MLGSVLKTLVEELLGNRTLDETLFYQLLNSAKNRRERLRPWVILRSEDSTQEATSADDYTTMKDLPARFIGFYSSQREGDAGPMQLIHENTVSDYYQIRMIQKHKHKDTPGYFYFDLKNSKFALCGSVDQTYTIYIYFLQGTADIDADTEWAFPEAYHMILANDVAKQQKGDIDYDEINARMYKYHGATEAELWSSMCMWDSQLQQKELRA